MLVGSLLTGPEKASGLRSIGFVLRWNEEPPSAAAAKSQHAMEGAETADLDVNTELAPSPLSFDPNRTSKRRVRRGSDPIHNRC
ncbi:hypothetical protein Taro_006858 [Colocasia esculenta]|uniref:Uncharacterized protein n=1 Tax=Colocasia esculenta TaxID=4460 RepID=A0A843TWH4_COLES|nr:hypothetical protein [Colocasia esculenta]